MTGLRLLTVSPWGVVPGLIHGFEQRDPRQGDSREAAKQRASLALSERGRLLFLRQVHGARVCLAPWEGTPEGDAAIAHRPGLILGIETADCLPVMIVDRKRRAVAAVHAGWRGTVAGVTARTVETLVTMGSDPADLEAALGPSIGPCCYEVGDDVWEAFGPAGRALFRMGPTGRRHLDVRAANARQLKDAGVTEGRIHTVSDCTCCRPDLYHSYRREGGVAGRMISFVGWAESSRPR